MTIYGYSARRLNGGSPGRGSGGQVELCAPPLARRECPMRGSHAKPDAGGDFRSAVPLTDYLRKWPAVATSCADAHLPATAQ